MINVQKEKYLYYFCKINYYIIEHINYSDNLLTWNWVETYEYSMNSTLGLTSELITQNETITELREVFFNLHVDQKYLVNDYRVETYLSIKNRRALIQKHIDRYLSLVLTAYEKNLIKDFEEVFKEYNEAFDKQNEEYGYFLEGIAYVHLNNLKNKAIKTLDKLLE